MDIILWRILDISAVMTVNVFWRKGVIVNFALDSVIFAPLVRKRFQQGAAP
jgi:hypothetical protein